MAERYTASDVISVFDAALLWYGKDPYQKLHGYGHYGWIVLLTRDREVRDVACAILFDIDRGKLEAVCPSWLSGIPPSWMTTLGPMPGNLDPRGTTVTLDSLVEFAKRRRDKPKFLASVVPDPVCDAVPDSGTHSGGAGRPSAMHLIERELRRAAEAGDLEESRAKQAQVLHDWLKAAHPTLRAPTSKTISNHLSKGGLFRNLKSGSPK